MNEVAAGVGQLTPPLVPTDRARTAEIFAEVLRGNLRTRRPELLARDTVVGQHAAQTFDAAVEAVAACEPAMDLLLTIGGLRPSFLRSTVDTALMVAVMGCRRDWSDERVLSATISALLADVGMLRLSDDTHLTKPGPLSPAEQQMVRMHPEMGAELLASVAHLLGPEICDVALQHHERVDGGGYPGGLRGNQIIEEAQAVGIGHLYTAATHFRPYREALSPAKTMALIEGLAGHAWDPRLVRAFVDGIDPYPVGTLVKLSSGECGCVVRGGESLRPLVEVRWTSSGADTEPRLVPASTSATGLRIVAVGE